FSANMRIDVSSTTAAVATILDRVLGLNIPQRILFVVAASRDQIASQLGRRKLSHEEPAENTITQLALVSALFPPVSLIPVFQPSAYALRNPGRASAMVA